MSKIPGGGSAPFVYCGDVDFVDWEGERPITVQWRLPERFPEAQAGAQANRLTGRGVLRPCRVRPVALCDGGSDWVALCEACLRREIRPKIPQVNNLSS